MTSTAILAAGVLLVAAGCFGGAPAAAPRPSAAILARDIARVPIRAVGWSVHDVRCVLASDRRRVDCSGTLRERTDSFTGRVTHDRIRFAFAVTPAGRLGSPVCRVRTATTNPYCILTP
ncbi:MAG TPA: hypothetical protein VGL44_07565 [Gaiellales bacterium]|jgi:hypothetical protein